MQRACIAACAALAMLLSFVLTAAAANQVLGFPFAAPDSRAQALQSASPPLPSGQGSLPQRAPGMGAFPGTAGMTPGMMQASPYGTYGPYDSPYGSSAAYGATPLYVPGAKAPARPGTGFTGAPAWAQHPYPLDYGDFPPFGANLFQGYFSGTYSEGQNSRYTIMPGDRIQVSIWGAHTYNEVLPVDQQGNLFLPEIGPVPVAGQTQQSLQGQIRAHIASVFRSNVEVYVNLLTAQPVAVYVTGFVARPGRYAGGTNDSVLYYLDRAGGILAERGTYRDVTVQRDNRTIRRVDLYSFILQGKLPGGALQDGDVIVVGPKGGSVTAMGLIPQQASFESKGKSGSMAGSELITFAAPLPAASHASVTGTRDAVPFHVYVGMAEFSKLTLHPEDKVEFLADTPGDSIMVTVSGSVRGATRYPITRAATLRALLAHVPADQSLSNLDGIYIKRRSVMEQQKKAIEDALYRLENSVLTATSLTNEQAAIRVQEAQMVQRFVERARQLTPDGVVVVTRKGDVADILLEDGDEVVIPQKSDVIQIVGEVMMPKSVVFNKASGLDGYIADAGGYTDRADSGAILVVHANGEIEEASDRKLAPGDLVMVLPRYDSKGYQIFKDLMQMLFQLAVTTKVVLTM